MIWTDQIGHRCSVEHTDEKGRNKYIVYVLSSVCVHSGIVLNAAHWRHTLSKGSPDQSVEIGYWTSAESLGSIIAQYGMHMATETSEFVQHVCTRC